MPRDPLTHVGIKVLIDGIELPCDDTNTPSILSGLKVTWGRADRLAQPAASTCDFEILDPDGGDDYTLAIAYNSPVEVLAVAPDGTQSRVFGGHVSDLSLVHEAGSDAVLSVTAIDPTTRLSSVMIGTHPWPNQTPAQRRTSIISAMGSGTMYWPALPTRNTAGVQQARWDVDNQTAWDIVQQFLWGIAVVPWPIAYGSQLQPGIIQTVGVNDFIKPTYDQRDNRRIPYADFLSIDDRGQQNAIPTVVLDSCDVDLDGTTFTANPSDTKQRIRVAWGASQGDDEGGTGTYVRDYTDNTDEFRTFDVTSLVGTVGAASNVATYWSFHMGEWAQDFDAPWAVGALHLDPDTITGMDDFNVAMVRLLEQTIRPIHWVMLQNLPAWAPWRDKTAHSAEPNVFGMLQGGIYAYDEGRWVLDLTIAVECSLEGALAPPLVVVVSPGDVVPFEHDASSVTFEPDPAEAWPVGAVATFNDGAYGWNGTAWVHGGTRAIVVSPGDVVPVASTDARVRPDPRTAWGIDDYATFSDGTYRWTGSGWTLWVPPVYVSPGDVVDLAHDDLAVRPSPSTAWVAPGQYAIFTDGAYRWTGTWYWAPLTLVAPGDTTTLAHDSPSAAPNPTTPWAIDEAATFSDGDYQWDGSAWVVAPVVVAPGDVVDVPHDDPRVVADPSTAWDAKAYATFSDGAWRWDGAAWVESTTITVRAYDTVTVAHTDTRVVPEPATSAWWVPGSGSTVMAPAWFSDGTWSWQRTYWQRVYVIEPGDTSSRNVADPTTTPWPNAAWAADEHATLAGAAYRWSGSAWVAWVPSWDAVAEGTAWDDVPAGTSWSEWTGEA